MEMLSPILGSYTTDYGQQALSYWCPGCKESHRIPVSDTHNPGKSWGCNGNILQPTFTPSILVTTGHYIPSFVTGSGCACDYHIRHPERKPWDWPCIRCHVFIRDGMIEFLGDCTHDLVGQTVPIPEWPKNKQ